MGGGSEMAYPKWVWTPAGGWYCHPKQWKRNTAIVGFGWAVALFMTFRLSSSLERRLNPPDRPIPSQQWCKFARTDDPTVGSLD